MTIDAIELTLKAVHMEFEYFHVCKTSNSCLAAMTSIWTAKIGEALIQMWQKHIIVRLFSCRFVLLTKRLGKSILSMFSVHHLYKTNNSTEYN